MLTHFSIRHHQGKKGLSKKHQEEEDEIKGNIKQKIIGGVIGDFNYYVENWNIFLSKGL